VLANQNSSCLHFSIIIKAACQSSQLANDKEALLKLVVPFQILYFNAIPTQTAKLVKLPFVSSTIKFVITEVLNIAAPIFRPTYFWPNNFLGVQIVKGLITHPQIN
jgi:hypothetical protein